MRGVATFIIVGLVAIGSAKLPDSRVGKIWDIANDRFLNQQDLWFQDGDFLANIQLLKIQAERWPSNYDVWTNLGWMQENVEEWDQALATYVRYRRSNPQDPDASLPEAFYYSRKKLYTKVPELLEPAIKRNCHPNNFRLLAQAYEKQKMYSDSVRVWKLYLQRAPSDAAAQHNLARVEKKLSGGA